MSATVVKNTIKMTRGDTFIGTVEIFDNEGNAYQPTAGDVVRFAMKHPDMTQGNKQFVDENPLVVKVIPSDTMLLIIEPADTKSLDFGNYTYDLQITFEDGIVDTFVENASLVLKPEVD